MAAAAAEEEHGPAAEEARDPVAALDLAAAAAPGPVGERDPAAARGHLREALQACRGRSLLLRRAVLPAAVMRIGKEARRDNRLANCLRPERGRQEAAIGQPPEMWLLETDPMLGNALPPETSLPIVQMSAINLVVA
ncbi:MAG TPA: hypothetical protein VKH44_00400 [Pirellulaceae bacterium]|nr:hypothetical protein [Pirellulaceae bacterium]